MSDSLKNPEFLQRLCEQNGLERALKLFPNGVKAAAERGLRPLDDLPPENSPLTHPAPVFDPSRFERK
jgi:hypothetical protein